LVAIEKEIRIPDIGDFENVEVIEVLVATGDSVEREDSLVTIESDKASMEIPSPFGGVIGEIAVSVGDRVSQGALVARITTSDAESDAEPVASTQEAVTSVANDEHHASDTPPTNHRRMGNDEAVTREEPPASTALPAQKAAVPPSPPPDSAAAAPAARTAHASPSARKFARELGANLDLVQGSGRKGRIIKEDIQNFIKRALQQGGASAPLENVLQVTPARSVDFSEFGEIEITPLNNIRKIAAKSLHRSWVTIPHVTQFDEADITELEAYRKSQQAEGEQRGVKLTALTFVMKAVVSTLKEFPEFCASLDETAENLILKRYFHIGIAVDTPNGLVVPVVRDVDRKGLFDLAAELAEISERARNRKLTRADLSGGCFTISSLGGIGGTAFTPIINGPEVAILGVSRHVLKPVYRDAQFIPRLTLPLSLSYDHRVIDGAAAARFTTKLKDVLSDVRNLVL
jgi:pyruvate dehydrogenase E2 component (dihydrolipoamide acetyltransferase)